MTTLDSAPEAPGRERARAPLNPKVDVSLSKKKVSFLQIFFPLAAPAFYVKECTKTLK